MTMSGGVAPPTFVEVEPGLPVLPGSGSTNRDAQAPVGDGGSLLLRVFGLSVLFLPLINIIVFTFNNPAGRYNISWDGFTLNNWLDPFKDKELTDAFIRSLEVAVLSISIALIMGSLVAIALARYRFTGSGTEIFLVLPLTTPEIVLGASLYQLFWGSDVVVWFLYRGDCARDVLRQLCGPDSQGKSSRV